ncbi:MAG: V-type ATP synthase subunit F [Candidatus Diapherotrites archaeon]|uniref:A-type ATP synthase subunit F n=1 Tax=Candidatus Iainarchaeum sp. TaxID=3101447 RepID=A0A8T3YPA3_9ARCH|nr:V-type ATP synthase subunit F [Candidatus Diapherotrites archaeon]
MVGADAVLVKYNHRIAVVADGPTCTGFRLAGVPAESTFPAEGAAAEKKIEELLASEETGILIVSEKAMNGMDWRLKKRIERLAKPVVIAIPDKDGPAAEKGDSLREMVKKALGFELMK